MSNAPSIHYVRTGDGADIAYWALGQGPLLLHSPNVQRVEVVRRGRVRRGKLYYLRKLRGKKARIRERRIR